MTEKDLLDLDFTRVVDDANGPSYHYYTYDVGSFSLISAGSYEVKNDEWFVDVFESPEIRFTDPTELSTLLTLLTNNYTEK